MYCSSPHTIRRPIETMPLANTPEFKHEAVRQITKKGHAVTEVAVCLGILIHSLYKWVKAASPNKE